MQKEFPKLEFRKVAVNLASGDPKTYMDPLTEATKDIDVTLVFNNAGFITTGFYSDVPLGRSMANYHCNATAILPITHHFLEKMVAKKSKGLIAFTSSSANLLPNPLSALYSATKAFMTMFAVSLAGEIRAQGIDVVVVHPSPIASNFFNNGKDLDALMFFKQVAQGPSVIADVVFSSAGRFVVRDQGLVTIGFRILLKFLDPSFFCEVTSLFGSVSGDYKKHMASRKKSS
jgi:short-subunit dehydrogenase